MSNLFPFDGMQVVVNDLVCVTNEWKQYRFPKSKKKRIRKKWAKKAFNYKVLELHKAIQFDGKLYVSKKTFEQLKAIENCK